MATATQEPRRCRGTVCTRLLAFGALVAVVLLLAPKVLPGAASKDGEVSSDGAHEHRGSLPPFKLGPVQNFKALSAAELQTLEDGKLVLRQEEDPTRGKGLAVRDMAAKPEDVMQELVDFKSYAKKVAMCSKSTVYGQNKLGGGKEQVKVEMSSTILPGWSFHCYFDHTVDMKGRSMIWSLDYDKRSDVDDIQGMWYVEQHPSKEGWSRVYYQIDMRMRYKVPGVLYRALSKSSLSSAVSWVKDHSERRATR
mmetsp:Transcript_2398/g.4383  ORF Transcript_2398/g.4383 Transcript_2398/m.4383 type:complete len:252 (-) Transcript_2398:56-811(-)|eukprot:CAMPEP_0197655796 /NCGR_PEP_ID=MMETSP1338-20131121/39674_1 /TAXON_ID=43686 ORGANISM="Pelagodinium beii, Strain RCC1491" /NCGR_SAMPLE_ID=MMETSP1338 /ASSEMBLY_ACC=CAM_ASM_000754 /LENGTH=251 /DNA_ID=CAMNT_0043231513 /DNA_START=13 /DNA_END=768 /DNA_ORIENTATION=-